MDRIERNLEATWRQQVPPPFSLVAGNNKITANNTVIISCMKSTASMNNIIKNNLQRESHHLRFLSINAVFSMLLIATLKTLHKAVPCVYAHYKVPLSENNYHCTICLYDCL